MAKKRLLMRKIRDILRLRLDCKLSDRKIATSLGISRGAVVRCLKRFKSSEITWPLPDVLTDEELEQGLYKIVKDASLESDIPHPNWKQLSIELSGVGVTRQLLWEEYIEEQPHGLKYSQFCQSFRDYRKSLDLPYKHHYKGGEMSFVDYSGKSIHIINRFTGELILTELFVWTWGASNLTYFEFTRSQTMQDFIGSHVRGLDYFGCVPKVICPDNLKSAVNKPNRYESELNFNYQRFSEHYNTAVVPARVRKPKDKAKVECHVLIAQRWVIAVLRHEVFFSLEELNIRARDLLEVFNNKKMQKLGQSRREVFNDLDKPAARPLPLNKYENSRWKVDVRLHVDYHFEIDKYFYSAPYALRKKLLNVKITENMIEAFYDNQRVASHKRLRGKQRFSTNKNHMPISHQKYTEWNSDRILDWTESVGPKTRTIAEAMLCNKSHPQQAYRSILGIINLKKQYPLERLELACARALNYHQYSYKAIKRILEKNLDQVSFTNQVIEKQILPAHENIRGQEYYK